MTERLQWEKKNHAKRDNSDCDQTHNQQISNIIPDILCIKHLHEMNQFILSLCHITEAALHADFLNWW